MTVRRLSFPLPTSMSDRTRKVPIISPLEAHRAFMKKTSEGWEIAELYAIDDHPLITPACDVNGPTGMREHHDD